MWLYFCTLKTHSSIIVVENADDSIPHVKCHPENSKEESNSCP